MCFYTVAPIKTLSKLILSDWLKKNARFVWLGNWRNLIPRLGGREVFVLLARKSRILFVKNKERMKIC